ncbi:MAG: phosphoesterase, partial [Candidatus Amulumruptor sp.]|nr:phosphoesterase [Candidatus Amulumruptor sp.]
MNRLIITLAAAMAAYITASADYSGRVYVDKNNNGVCDRGEKTLAGVAVSDGLNVVKTGRDGSFTLPGHE